MKNATYFLLLTFGILLVCISPARSQSTGAAEDSVRAAVNMLFTAMKHSDGDALRAAFTDSAILQTIVDGKDGKTEVLNYPVAAFAATIAKLPAGAADENIQFDVLRIDGPLAIVWAPYRFYFNGKLSHCGIDSFQLLRVGGIWKILYIIDTRRKDCN